MRRKLVFTTGAMILGTIIASFNSIAVNGIFLSSLLFFLFVNKRYKIISKKMIIILGIGLVFGNCRYLIAQNTYDSNIEKEDFKKHHTIARINRIQQKSGEKYKLFVDIIMQDGKTTNKKALLTYHKNIDKWEQLSGMEIEFYGRLDLPSQRRNPKCFDYRQYLRSEKIDFISNIHFFNVSKKEKGMCGKFSTFILENREKFLEKLSCDEEGKAFIRGVIFGEKSQLSEETYDEFKNNGTAHILAISGLHIGILYGVYKWFLKKNNSFAITFIFIIILVLYGALTLWTISVVRAVAMVITATFAELLERRYDFLTAAFLIGAVIVVLNPFAIENVGFQMSFLAVISIGILEPFISKKVSRKIGMILAVQMGMLPYIAYVFNYLPIFSAFINIPIVFLITLIVPLGLLNFLLFLSIDLFSTVRYITEFFAQLQNIILNVPTSALTDFLIWLNSRLESDGGFVADVISPPLWLIVIFYFTVFFTASELGAITYIRKAWKNIIPVAALAVVLAASCIVYEQSPFDRAFATFLDVGQGDCVHIKNHDGKNVMIDGGGKIGYNLGKKLLKPYFLKNGVIGLDLAAVTHLHTDHYKGVSELSEVYSISQVLTEGKAGEIIDLGNDLTIHILWPMSKNNKSKDENLNSVIYKVIYRDISILITGDITAEGEKLLIDQYRGTDMLKSDVLKIPHHGSKYSTCDDFLSEVEPALAIVQVGINNYGHPADEVIEKLEKKDIMVFRTDQSGAVGIIYEKGSIEICTEIDNKREVLKSLEKN